jgi:hypothetical protein
MREGLFFPIGVTDRATNNSADSRKNKLTSCEPSESEQYNPECSVRPSYTISFGIQPISELLYDIWVIYCFHGAPFFKFLFLVIYSGNFLLTYR